MQSWYPIYCYRVATNNVRLQQRDVDVGKWGRNKLCVNSTAAPQRGGNFIFVFTVLGGARDCHGRLPSCAAAAHCALSPRSD